jgi:CRISPR-associated endonuclease/helicase Cas3
MENVIFDYKNDIDNLGENYLSTNEAIDNYYGKYFNSVKDNMNYSIKSLNDNMFDLLAVNTKHREGYFTNTGESYNRTMAQSYKTAGDNFEVIGKNTVGLIVHYNENDKDIEILEKSKDFNEIKKALKSLQRYTVNLYDSDKVLKGLIERHAITQLLDGAVNIVDKNYYDENFGVHTELENMII